MQKKIIQGNGSEIIFVKGKANFSGLLIVATSTETEPANYSPEDVRIEGVVTRPSFTTQICAGNLYALSLGDDPSSRENAATPVASGQTAARGYYVPFGQVVNLKGSDQAQFTVTVSNNSIYQTTIYVLDSVGVGLYTPVVQVIPVPKDRNSFNQDLGDNITKISMLNTSTDYGVTSASIMSDKWPAQYGVSEFQALIATQNKQGTTAPTLSCILFESPVPLNGVSINCSVDTASGGNTYLVVYGGYRSELVSARAASMLEKHKNENARTYFGV